jgi:phosphatidate phosphatase LPIN
MYYRHCCPYINVLYLQAPIAEPDFLDLNAIPGKDAESASATSPPPPFIELPPVGAPLVVHDNLPDAFTIPETPSKVLQPSSLLGHSSEYGTGLAAAAVRVLREEEKECDGQIKDQITAAQNIAKRRLVSHIPTIKVGNEDGGDEALPITGEEGAQAPPVEYKQDVVLDMEGYHSRERSDRTVTGSERDIGAMVDGVRHGVKKQSVLALSFPVEDSGVLRSDRRHSQEYLTSNEEDLTPTSSRAQSPEPTTPGTSPSTHGVPMQRATSEPPGIGHAPAASPPRYSWEWGNFPKSTSTPKLPESEPASRPPERASTLPNAPPTPPSMRDEKSAVAATVDEELTVHFGKGGRLTAGDAGGFMLELEGRTVNFDLSLCGDLGEVMKRGAGEVEKAVKRFAERRVTFQQFIDDPVIVHNDDLCVRWRGRYVFSLISSFRITCVDRGRRRFISRKDSSPILAALIVWRQSTLRAAVGATSEEEPLSSSDERDLLRPAAGSQFAVKTSRSSWRLGWWRTQSAREISAQATDSKEPTSGPMGPLRPGLQPVASAPDSMVSVFPIFY